MRNDRAFTARGSDEDGDELVGLAWDRGRAFRIPVPVPYSVFVRFRRLSKQEVTNAQAAGPTKASPPTSSAKPTRGGGSVLSP